MGRKTSSFERGTLKQNNNPENVTDINRKVKILQLAFI